MSNPPDRPDQPDPESQPEQGFPQHLPLPTGPQDQPPASPQGHAQEQPQPQGPPPQGPPQFQGPPPQNQQPAPDQPRFQAPPVPQHPYQGQPPQQGQPPYPGQPPAGAGQGSDTPDTDVRPPKYWYWIAVAIFAVSLLVSTIMLMNATVDTPALIILGILLPMVAFVVSLGVGITVFAVRSSRLSRQRAQRMYGAGMGFPGPMAPPGYPGPAFHGPPPPPPAIPAEDVRPRRRWMVVSALCLPLSIVLGISLMWMIGSSVSDEGPEFSSTVIGGSGTASFSVSADQVDSLGLYVAPRDAHQEGCYLTGQGTPRLVEKVVAYSHDEWVLAYSVEVPQPGTYTLHCSGDSNTEYVIADTNIAVEEDSTMAAGFAFMMLTIMAGTLATLVGVVVVGVRRAGHRQRLIREHHARMYQSGPAHP